MNGTSRYENELLNSFYPSDKMKLEHYSSISPVVELQSTFYEIPSQEERCNDHSGCIRSVLVVQ